VESESDDRRGLSLTQDGGFPGIIEPKDQDAHLLGPEETLEDATEEEAHGEEAGGGGIAMHRGDAFCPLLPLIPGITQYYPVLPKLAIVPLFTPYSPIVPLIPLFTPYSPVLPLIPLFYLLFPYLPLIPLYSLVCACCSSSASSSPPLPPSLPASLRSAPPLRGNSFSKASGICFCQVDLFYPKKQRVLMR
jgi:hypothetical protein